MGRNYVGLTDLGKVRENNEDTFIAAETSDGKYIIACVIDGVGGYSGGEIAAEIARHSILEHLNRGAKDFITVMKQAIVEADHRIIQEKQKVKDHENMACVVTLALIDLRNNQFFYAHVGDTRLYLFRDRSLVKISKDQSFVGFMEDSGRITEEQAMRHPKRNEINKALGFGANLSLQDDYIETGHSPFLPGDSLLLCSDGLSDMVNKQEITNILVKKLSLEEQCTELIRAANTNGGLDNITVVLVKNTNQAPKHEALKPSGTVRKQVIAQPQPIQAPVAPEPPKIKASETPRRGNGMIWFLGSLCAVLFLGCIYLVWLNNKNVNKVEQQKLGAFKNPRNPQEKKLQDTLNNLQGNVLIITDSMFKTPVLISEPLTFNKDTLFLIAKSPIVFRRDSLFKGNAMEIQPLSRQVVLENITFENFDTVITIHNTSLTLKNIRFINSINAINNLYHFQQGKFINGKIPANTFKTDTIPVKVND